MKTNKISLIIVFILVSSFFISCNKEDESRTRADEIEELEEYLSANQITQIPTWTGLYYFEIEEGTGAYPEYYDSVYVNYSVKSLKGATIGSNDDLGEPALFLMGSSYVIHGVNESMSLTKEGGVGQSLIPSTLAFGSYDYDNLGSYQTLIYDIELVEIRPGIPVEEYDVEGLTINITDSGLEYYIVKSTENAKVYSGDEVELHYTGYFTNGKIFDSSVKRGETISLQIGVGKLISGWDEGLLLMHIGEKYRFIIPPDLAYGEEGSFPIIPPNETLIFDVEVIDIP